MSIDREIEPNAPDWSKEVRSDDLLVQTLSERLKTSFVEIQERENIEQLLKRLKDLGFTPKR